MQWLTSEDALNTPFTLSVQAAVEELQIMKLKASRYSIVIERLFIPCKAGH